MAKFRTPYRQRITEYCAHHGIVIPDNFDAPKSSDKFVLVDITKEPHQIVSRSTYLPADVIRYITDPNNEHRKFVILDFKRCCEMSYAGGTLLIRGRPIECKCQDELKLLAHGAGVTVPRCRGQVFPFATPAGF